MDVENLTNEHALEIYMKPGCPYCDKAFEFYDKRNIKYTSYDAQTDAVLRRKMLALTAGNPTVPAIVVNGKYVQSGWGKPPHG